MIRSPKERLRLGSNTNGLLNLSPRALWAKTPGPGVPNEPPLTGSSETRRQPYEDAGDELGDDLARDGRGGKRLVGGVPGLAAGSFAGSRRRANALFQSQAGEGCVCNPRAGGGSARAIEKNVAVFGDSDCLSGPPSPVTRMAVLQRQGRACDPSRSSFHSRSALHRAHGFARFARAAPPDLRRRPLSHTRPVPLRAIASSAALSVFSVAKRRRALVAAALGSEGSHSPAETLGPVSGVSVGEPASERAKRSRPLPAARVADRRISLILRQTALDSSASNLSLVFSSAPADPASWPQGPHAQLQRALIH